MFTMHFLGFSFPKLLNVTVTDDYTSYRMYLKRCIILKDVKYYVKDVVHKREKQEKGCYGLISHIYI